MDELSIKAGPGGWVAPHGTPQGTIYVRFAQFDGSWRPIELFRMPLTAEHVRGLPLYRIELAVNASEPVSAALAARIDEPVPQLGSPEFYDLWTGYGHMREPPIALLRPAGRRLTDDWYEQVAHAYRLATARGLKPRTAIANAAGVSTDVAGRWVYEARKRGFLAKGSPGRVTT